MDRAPWRRLALGGMLAAGCTRIRDHQGHLIDDSLVAAIQPGVDNRDSVAGTLGRPTFVGQFDQRDWYYVSRNTRQLAFNMPRPRADRPSRPLRRGRQRPDRRPGPASSWSPTSSRRATRRRRSAAAAACSRSCSAISARSASAARAPPPRTIRADLSYQLRKIPHSLGPDPGVGLPARSKTKTWASKICTTQQPAALPSQPELI